MSERLETLVDAALLIVATCFVLIPELRVPPVRVALIVLVAGGGAMFTWRMHKSGMLGLTPKGILHSTNRPRASLLSTAAALMGVIAVVVSSLR